MTHKVPSWPKVKRRDNDSSYHCAGPGASMRPAACVYVAASAALVLLAGIGTVWGQSAGEYFHGGAQHFVHGRSREAKQMVTEGLARYPKDPQLSALAALIREEEQQQQNQQQQNKQQDQKQDEGKDQQDRDQQDKQDQSDQQKQPPRPQPQQSEEKMKKEEAARLLRQFADDDKNLNKPEKKAIAPGARPEKDW